MRLLNSCSWEMKEFISDVSVPPYAILSHTWGELEDECTLRDWETMDSSELEKKRGFQKIAHCRQQAARDGLEWVWVDTCCIDKTSSAELTEAINSMFRWYKNSAVCYAYFVDVSNPESTTLITNAVTMEQFEQSRWFRRGWTLQELIAPTDVFFYSREWHHLGTKIGLSTIISDITNIEPQFLDSKNLESASIAQKMSWASKRETSRPEDIAYCLLGIFDVNMPMIYGEGTKAFLRLQEEIMDTYPYDFSIFAWGEPVSKCSREIDAETAIGDRPLEMESLDAREDYLFGLLAESPRDYASSGQITLPPELHDFFMHEVPIQQRNKNTISLNLAMEPVVRPITFRHPRYEILQFKNLQYAILPCRLGTDAVHYVKIPLVVPYLGGTISGRIREMIIAVIFPIDMYLCLRLRDFKTMHTVAPLTHYRPSEAGDIMFRRAVMPISRKSNMMAYGSCIGIEQILPRANAVDKNLWRLLVPLEENTAFAIVLRSNSSPTTPYGVLYFKFYVIPLPYDKAIKLDLQWFADRHLFYEQKAVPFSPQTPIIDVGPTLKARVGSERIYIDGDPARPVDLVDIVVAGKGYAPHWWPQSPYSPASSESSFCLDSLFGNQSIQERSEHEPEKDEHVGTIGPVLTPSKDRCEKQGGDAAPQRTVNNRSSRLDRRRSV